MKILTLISLATISLGTVAISQPSQALLNAPYSYGRFCGAGNSQIGREPVDELDAACKRHDMCSGDAMIPACSCHVALEHDAIEFARNESNPKTIRQLATNIARVITQIPCAGARRSITPASATSDSLRW